VVVPGKGASAHDLAVEETVLRASGLL